MGYRPPKGVRPPQFEGKRTGRPKGTKNFAWVWADAIWGYEHRNESQVRPPTRQAELWWRFALLYPNELEDFLADYDRL